MNALLDSVRWFFPWLWQATCQASVVILLVLAVQWIFRKQLAPRWHHALWLLVVIRLLLPFSIETRVSLFNWIPHPTAPAGVTAVAVILPQPVAAPVTAETTSP